MKIYIALFQYCCTAYNILIGFFVITFNICVSGSPIYSLKRILFIFHIRSLISCREIPNKIFLFQYWNFNCLSHIFFYSFVELVFHCTCTCGECFGI